MSVPNRQIGWGAEENLLAFIIKQLQYLTTVVANNGGGGSQTLAETLVLGNTTGGANVSISSGDAVILDNGSMLKKGTIDAGYGGANGISQICAVGYELKWEAGRLYVMGDGGTTIREVSHNFTTTPTATDDTSKGFIVGSRWLLDDGTLYVCTDNTSTAAVWVLQPSIPTKTSDLINDGDNGTSHFISLEDLPSNLVLYPTSTASDIGGYSKIVTSITDPSYDVTAVNITTGAISGSNQLIASLATSANIIIGNPGLFNVSTIGNIRRTAGSGTAEFYFEVYKRTSGGAETLITTSSNTSPISSAIYSQFSATALWNDGIFLATDRIVLKFYGTKVGSGSSPTYDFQFGGSNPVRTTVPIPLNVVPNINVEQLNNFSDVSYTSPIDADSVMVKDSTASLWKRFTFANLKALIRNTLLTGLSTSSSANVLATDTVLEGIGKLQAQSALKRTILHADSVPTAAHTGTTTITQIGSTIIIPANTFSADDEFVLDSLGISKTGILGTCVWRLAQNTSDTLTGANILASGSLTATQITGNMGRRFEINGGNLKCRLGGTTTGYTDMGASTVAGLSVTFDPTITQYFFRTVTLSVATDSVVSTQIVMLK
jgi:hypothetical protein